MLIPGFFETFFAFQFCLSCFPKEKTKFLEVFKDEMSFNESLYLSKSGWDVM